MVFSLTLDMQVDPSADGRRHVVVSDAEVRTHVLPPDPVNLQGVTVPGLDQPVLGAA